MATKKNGARERVPLSVLDLCPVSEGATHKEALDASLKLAQVVDRYGYHRFWMAEHHGSQTFLSSSTALLLARAAERTQNIRIGAGGVMMPNHVPLLVAEAYGTLGTIYPGRIDLGVGRAPGTDPMTVQALNRRSAELRDYAQDIAEVISYLGDRPELTSEDSGPSGAEAGAVGVAYDSSTTPHQVRALPGEGTKVPVWLLGSSTGGARVAGALGMPYSFASHFAPGVAKEAISLYRSEFNPSALTAQCEKPYVSGGVIMMCAPTTEEAVHLLTSAQQLNVNIRRGLALPLPPPVDDLSTVMSAEELEFTNNKAGLYAVGNPQEVAAQLDQIVEEYDFDELTLICHAFDPLARRRSYQLLARQWGQVSIFPTED